MFHTTKHAEGRRGSFVRLVRLDTEDYAVIVRSPLDGRLYHRYIGPDLTKADEIFNAEAEKLSAHPGHGEPV